MAERKKVLYGNHQVGNKVYSITPDTSDAELKRIVKESPAMEKFITLADDNDNKKSSDSGKAKPKSK